MKKTVRDLSRKKIAEIATQYAQTNFAYSHDYFSREYAISKGTFYTALEKAVIENIVDDKTVEQMAAKAAYNSQVKAAEAGKQRSKKHYDYLLLKRRQYMPSKEQAIIWTTEYANCKYHKNDFATKNFITVALLNRVIYKAIVDSWVTDDIVELLKEKSLSKEQSQKVIKFWENIEYFRNGNKKDQG